MKRLGESKYLDFSEVTLSMRRGTQPYYLRQWSIRKKSKRIRTVSRYAYNQAHLPVREQDEAVGHAVRAVYLYSGMADIARLT